MSRKITFQFDEDYPDDVVARSIREFTSRIIDKVSLRPGLSYWLYADPGYRIGTVKVEHVSANKP